MWWVPQLPRTGITHITGPAQKDIAAALQLAVSTTENALRTLRYHGIVEARYRKAVKIGMRWVKNYTELDFRSLGSYSRAELDAIAAAPDAL